MIRSHRDDPDAVAYVLERINALLSIGFQQDMTGEERAALIREYQRQVAPFPKWAIARGLDLAQRSTPKRRPTPGEVFTCCDEQVERVRAEIRHRREAERQAEARRSGAAQNRVTADQADAILREHGMTPQRIARVLAGRCPMPGREDEPEPEPPQPRHVEPGSAEDEALRRARAGNRIIAAMQAKAGRSAPVDEPGGDFDDPFGDESRA